jgi:hypothetical protein
MSHGVSVKMIVESFNATLTPSLRNLFKPTASIQPPSQTPLSSRPATAVTVAAVASPSLREAEAPEATQRPATAHVRPGTGYSDAGGTVTRVSLCPFAPMSLTCPFCQSGLSEWDSAEQFMPVPIVKLKVDSKPCIIRH